jgi:hypothetical protein
MVIRVWIRFKKIAWSGPEIQYTCKLPCWLLTTCIKCYDADPDQDPTLVRRIPTFPFSLMRIRILPLQNDPPRLPPFHFYVNPDLDPSFHFWCGSGYSFPRWCGSGCGSATLVDGSKANNWEYRLSNRQPDPQHYIRCTLGTHRESAHGGAVPLHHLR